MVKQILMKLYQYWQLYIFAGYKLLPIFQAIYLGIVQIKNNIPAWDKIEKELFQSKNTILKIKKQKVKK